MLSSTMHHSRLRLHTEAATAATIASTGILAHAGCGASRAAPAPAPYSTAPAGASTPRSVLLPVFWLLLLPPLLLLPAQEL